MIPEIVLTQAQTLDDWARQWSGEAASGSAEVAFLMQRAARKMRATLDGTAGVALIVAEEEKSHAPDVQPERPPERVEFRDG